MMEWNKIIPDPEPTISQQEWEGLSQELQTEIRAKMSSFNQRVEPAQAQFGDEKGYLIARIAGRRFAIPAHRVRGLGRVPTAAWLRKKIQTQLGEIPLKDLKRTMGVGGEAGSVYALIQNSNGLKAYVFDGFEGMRRDPVTLIRPLGKFARPYNDPLIVGTLHFSEHQTAPEPAPIFVLDVNNLDS